VNLNEFVRFSGYIKTKNTADNVKASSTALAIVLG